jgi:aldose 1-epimerase
MSMLDASRSSQSNDPDTPRYAIHSSALEAAFWPTAGGRLVHLRHSRFGDLLVPFKAASFDPDDWPKAGAFPLFPFHNRLRNAEFRLAGRSVRLKPNAANGDDVMHGPAHRRRWRISEHGPSHIEMTLDYLADEDWPFDFTAKQRFELDESGLNVGLCLRNTCNSPMPGGMGWHPYFMPSHDGMIRIFAGEAWDPFGANGLRDPIASPDRATGFSLPHGITHHYSSWSKATAQVGEGATITLSADGVLSCLAVLRRSHSLCLEPASHVAGALEAIEAAGSGPTMRILSPGEEMTGMARLTVA